MKQHFGGNATNMQTGAAQKGIFLHDHSFQSKFAGTNRGHIPARTASDNCYIVLCHAPSLSDVFLECHFRASQRGSRMPAAPKISRRAISFYSANQFLARSREAKRDGTKGQRGMVQVRNGSPGPDKSEILAAVGTCRNLTTFYQR